MAGTSPLDDVIRQVLSPEGSGTSTLSHEELARRETFFKFSRSGQPTFLGRSPDATLRPGEAVIAVNPQGQARVVNSAGAGSDAEVLRRLAPRIARLPRLGGPLGLLLGLPGLVEQLQQTPPGPFSPAFRTLPIS